MIFNAVQYDKELSWVPMKLLMFSDVGLDYKTDDETLWRYCQEQGYLLVTGNRTGDDGDMSLELTIRRLITPTSLPVLTISNLQRVTSDPTYRQECAERLAEIVLDIETYHGVTRLYLSG